MGRWPALGEGGGEDGWGGGHALRDDYAVAVGLGWLAVPAVRCPPSALIAGSHYMLYSVGLFPCP